MNKTKTTITMKYDIPSALQKLTPGAEWVLRGGEYSGLDWIDGHGYDKPTAAEITAKIAELDGAEPMRILREERDRLIAETDWWVLPDRTASDAQLAYRQALRDLPSTASPVLDSSNTLGISGVTWPTKPS